MGYLVGFYYFTEIHVYSIYVQGLFANAPFMGCQAQMGYDHGLVVQSIVSLMSSTITNSLTVVH